MRFRALLGNGVALLLLVGTPRVAAAQMSASAPDGDPLGLTALNKAFGLKYGEFSFEMQQGGMELLKPFIYPLMSFPGVELWGKDESFRSDHLFFAIRYGQRQTDGNARKVRDTDVPNMMLVSHKSENFAEHLAHQEKWLTVRTVLGPVTGCARDTTLTDAGASVLITSAASWRRQGATVWFATEVTHRDPSVGRRPRRPLFAATYGVLRAGALAPYDTPPFATRTDPGCSIEREELTAMASPMDSTAFQQLRDRLRAR